MCAVQQASAGSYTSANQASLASASASASVIASLTGEPICVLDLESDGEMIDKLSLSRQTDIIPYAHLLY